MDSLVKVPIKFQNAQHPCKKNIQIRFIFSKNYLKTTLFFLNFQKLFQYIFIVVFMSGEKMDVKTKGKKRKQ